ncbi:MAG: class I SAM-dependent methyltransferase [Oscillospiraceae bacterium]|nr:class I SAM-dependent methyltransferase [Oscillospiraceae bacterium]
MDKKDVIEFFDRCAPSWDAGMIKDDRIIETILDHTGVTAGMDILDVACGTGVMFPYYLSRGVASVTGVDIAPEMAKIAAAKYSEDPRVQVVCGDVEEVKLDRKFDAVVVYNAFPHFPDPRKLIKTLSSLLKEGGHLTVAHGASRESIDNHHKGSASKVSNGLMSADSLKKLFEPYLQVEVVISNDRMYQVTGVKRQGHLHSHGDHTHSHDYEGEHSHGESETPMEELLALMKFMVRHNDAHAQELAELAQQLKTAGKNRAYQQIMDAVSDFDMVNAKLDAVVTELSVDDM